MKNENNGTIVLNMQITVEKVIYRRVNELAICIEIIFMQKIQYF